MYEIQRSKIFAKWFDKLRSMEIQSIVVSRIQRLKEGQFGDVKSVGDGVMEARIHVAGGLRLYYTRRGQQVIVLLVGGDKSSQQQDIIKAKEIVSMWED